VKVVDRPIDSIAKRNGRSGSLPTARSRAIGASAEVGIMPGSPLSLTLRPSVSPSTRTL
jgi:hypothetical protein